MSYIYHVCHSLASIEDEITHIKCVYVYISHKFFLLLFFTIYCILRMYHGAFDMKMGRTSRKK